MVRDGNRDLVEVLNGEEELSRRDFFEVAGKSLIAAVSAIKLSGCAGLHNISAEHASAFKGLQASTEEVVLPQGSYPILSDWGSSIDITTGGLLVPRPSPHNGIDFDAPYGTGVLAPGDGIAHVVKDSVSGLTVFIYPHRILQHAGKYYNVNIHATHLSGSTISKMRPVKRGEVVGYVGDDNTKYRHLHYGTAMQDPKTREWHYINPHWLWTQSGKPECFMPGKDYSSIEGLALTLPLPCKK